MYMPCAGKSMLKETKYLVLQTILIKLQLKGFVSEKNFLKVSLIKTKHCKRGSQTTAYRFLGNLDRVTTIN